MHMHQELLESGKKLVGEKGTATDRSVSEKSSLHTCGCMHKMNQSAWNGLDFKTAMPGSIFPALNLQSGGSLAFQADPFMARIFFFHKVIGWGTYPRVALIRSKYLPDCLSSLSYFLQTCPPKSPFPVKPLALPISCLSTLLQLSWNLCPWNNGISFP